MAYSHYLRTERPQTRVSHQSWRCLPEFPVTSENFLELHQCPSEDCPRQTGKRLNQCRNEQDGSGSGPREILVSVENSTAQRVKQARRSRLLRTTFSLVESS